MPNKSLSEAGCIYLVRSVVNLRPPLVLQDNLAHGFLDTPISFFFESNIIWRFDPGDVNQRYSMIHCFHSVSVWILIFIIRVTFSEMLMVTIMEAEDIPVHDLSGYAYSFVIAKALPCHGESNVEHKTRLVRAGFWPSFNDTIEFLVRKDELEQQTLTLYLFEMNRWTKQDGIGQLSMSLNGLGLLIGKEHVIKRRLSVYNPLSDVVSQLFLNLLALTVVLKTFELVRHIEP